MTPTMEEYQRRPPHPERIAGGHGQQPPGTSPLVSIITVTRNCAATIERTIKSVRAQSHPRTEHLVIDGGSTDGTLDVLRTYDQQLSWWISEPDSGISEAFNKGLARARGRFVGILNGDDWFEPDAVERSVAALVRHEVSVVHGMVQYWEGEQRAYCASGSHELLVRVCSINHPSVFADIELYRRHGLFDESFRLAMDYELFVRWQAAGVRFHYLAETIANMQLGGVSDRNQRRALAEVLRAKRKHHIGRFNVAYHTYLLAKLYGKRILHGLGLGSVVTLYRRHVSIVRKA